MEIKKGCTPRVSKTAQCIFDMPRICTERLRLYTESYRETEGELAVARQSKAFQLTLRDMTVKILEGELIVGCPCSKDRGGAVLPELNAQWLTREVDDMSVREWDRFHAPSPEERRDIFELLRYWENKSAYEMWEKRVPAPMMELHKTGFIGGVTFSNNGFYPGHMAVDFQKALKSGLKSIHAEAKARQEALDLSLIENLNKYHFYDAVMRSLEAVREFGMRYSVLAAKLARQENDPVRKAELKKISSICANVPWEPAGSFHEAVQSAYMVWVTLMVEGWGHGLTFGRPDQYLIEYYQKDIEAGILTREQALELIELWFVKINSTVTLDDLATATCFAGFPQAVNIVLGGVDKDGNCAVNELSYLIMEAERDIGMTAEDLVIRVSENTPPHFLLEAGRLAKHLKGKLKFVSDPVALKQFEADGYPLARARDYAMTGCNSPCISGVSLDYPGGLFNLPFVLELALNNGVSRITGKQAGLKTGDPRKFATFEQVWDAFYAQLRYFVGAAVVMMNEDRAIFAEYLPLPYQSALFDGPIERGLDIFSGGTGRFARQSFSLCGAPDVGDGLAALKRVVFEDRALTMEQVIDALDKNFEGFEEVLHLLERAPKFGNDDDYVDSLVDRVILAGSELAAGYRAYCGSPVCVAAATISANVPLGYGVGALPCGRRAGTPISEGGISPHQGRNTEGPTATFKSVAKLHHEKLTNGSVLNMRFDPDSLKDDSKIEKFVQLTRAYLLSGGFFVQYNIIDTETLKDAQRHPEQYKDLLVRVATYSAYFVELSTEMQNDIINRMEFKTM